MCLQDLFKVVRDGNLREDMMSMVDFLGLDRYSKNQSTNFKSVLRACSRAFFLGEDANEDSRQRLCGH
jgi:hypothetical protein